jgi:hypothetical protein
MENNEDWGEKYPRNEHPKTIHTLNAVPRKILVLKFNKWYEMGLSSLKAYLHGQ